MDIYGGKDFGVRPGDIVIDCGANIGSFTRRALTRGAARVITVEPTPELVESLRRTFAGDDRVTIVPKGVWDQAGEMSLGVVPGVSEGNSFVLHPELTNGPVVPLITIDALVAELHLAKVDFIKLDVEGAERNALKGAKQTLLSSHPRLAVEGHHLDDDPEVLPALVHELAPTYRAPVYACRPYKNVVMPEAMLFE
jgi:FkbM family methyltransferase